MYSKSFYKIVRNFKKKILNQTKINTEIDKASLKDAAYHIVLLAKNYEGLKNLYKLISLSHIEFFYKKPKIPKTVLENHKKGLIIGSACERGELFKAIIDGKQDSEIEKIAQLYDYFEIQPIGNNEFLIRNGIVEDEKELIKINNKICELGQKLNKPVVATGDVHFLEPEDSIYRKVLFGGQGYKDAEFQAPLYFKTTKEMLEEFQYLGQKKSEEVVITNPNLINEMIEDLRPIPEGVYPPSISNSRQTLIQLCNLKVHELYGNDLPKIVKARMEKELKSILENGYDVMYIIAQKLVKKSNEDGYLVGSRGSVGSSFVAFLLEITEINPLPPHYLCKICKNSEFVNENINKNGMDLENKTCKCGQNMKKNGFNIPFETFLGFHGEKVPDIDLNFSGEYQSTAHKYVETLFGKSQVFRAGTIGTIAEKTAAMFARKYYEKKGEEIPCSAEIKRISIGSIGVKRTTGQHPGGIIVCPNDKDIHEFCPIQHPADDRESGVVTTHFDFHSIHDNLLKLDILGHDDPTTLKMLENLTDIKAKEIPLDDKLTMSIFTSNKALKITAEKENDVGTLGIPEFGTKFVRQMLADTRPNTFYELILISGLSHGENVWIGNAYELIKQKIATLSEVICVRDDIMLYLISKGIDPKTSFDITEKVRKGKGINEDHEKTMLENNVPLWYVESCKKIKYMFPKAHASAYVVMAFRIAWFKVYYPIEFYISYFTIRADMFDATYAIKGITTAKRKIEEIIQKGRETTAKEQGLASILEICIEMYERGFEFLPIDLYESHATEFKKSNNYILPPLNSLAGLGVTASANIVKAREKGAFLSQDNLKFRAKLNKNVMELLEQNGCFKKLKKSSQITFFD